MGIQTSTLCLLRLSFFVLPPDGRQEVLEQQFQLAYYANGLGYEATEHMPVYERNFFYRRLSEVKMKEYEELTKAKGGGRR